MSEAAALRQFLLASTPVTSRHLANSFFLFSPQELEKLSLRIFFSFPLASFRDPHLEQLLSEGAEFWPEDAALLSLLVQSLQASPTGCLRPWGEIIFRLSPPEGLCLRLQKISPPVSSSSLVICLASLKRSGSLDNWVRPKAVKTSPCLVPPPCSWESC